MKVLLINPPRFNEILGNNPAIIESERSYNLPLGLLYVASYLREHTQHEVNVLDCQVEELSYAGLESSIRQIQPDVIGISVMTFTLLDVINTIRIIKRIDDNIKVILGGTHVNIYPEESIKIAGVDFIVLGEGEEVFKDLLDKLENRENIYELPGIVFKENGKIINNGRRQFIQDIDSLPFPARKITPYKKYSSLLAKNKVVTTMITSRGCPYRCTFCNRPVMGKIFRKRSPQNVIREIESCIDMGIHEFLIYDDNFTIDQERVFEICDGIIKRKLNIRWHVRAHINTITEGMVDKMIAAGCASIHYGIESGVDRILKIIKKDIDIEKTKEIFKMTKKKKIQTLAYFMIGLPTETLQDVRETFTLARRLDPDYMHLTIFTPFPSTDIYKNAIEKGIIKNDYWLDFALNPREDFIPSYWEEFFTREQLQELLKEGYKSFYLRPAYVFKRLSNLKTWCQFQRELHAGLSVLKM